ncbi:MAG: site-specific integrase [Bacteroidales bacterium]
MDHLPEVHIEFGEQHGKPFTVLRFKYNKPLIAKVKKISGSRWSKSLSAWVIPKEDSSSEDIVKELSGSASFEFKKGKNLATDHNIDTALPPGYLELLQQKRYSPNTIKTYSSYFLHFQRHFSTKNIERMKKEEINAYLLELINRNKISDSQQNQRINAIKNFHGRSKKDA